jgi:sec-independent protein translocase protein TatA
MEIFQPWHIIIVVGLALLFFGGKKLPELGKGLGEGFRGFKEGMKGITGNDDTPTPPNATAHAVTPKAETPTEPVTKA